jgi:hypothetical protein
MELKIVGYSCPRISQTLVNTSEAASEFDAPIDIAWISDAHGIAEMGKTSSPTIIMNGRIKQMGRVPSVYELTSWIREELEEEITVS